MENNDIKPGSSPDNGSNNETSTQSTPSMVKPEMQQELPEAELATQSALLPDQKVKNSRKFSIPKINLNRNTILAGSLALLLVVVGVVTLLMTRSTSENDTNDSVVMQEETPDLLGVAIILKEGTLQTRQTDNEEWLDATVDTEISQGTALRTVGATSRAVIAFDDGSALRLDANSEAELEIVTTERILVNHVSGYTYNRVLPSDGLKYIVTSTEAQYEALGTAFKTASTGDEQSVEVYHSSVVETGLNKTPKAGEKLVVINKASPTEQGTIKKLDIEEVKNDPFLQWNRELDANDENFKASLGFLSDITAPEITFNRTDGEVVLLEPNATEGTIEITGSTEAGANLTVLSKSQSGSTPVGVTVGGDGKFTTPVLSAPIGISVFEFVAKDRTGNTTTKTLRITFQRKSQPVAGNASSFVLSSNVTSDKLGLTWSLSGIEAKDGFKVVFEKDNPNPIFNSGGSESFPTKDTSSSIDLSKNLKDKGTYYVKICIYDAASGTCGQYSNAVTYVKS
jgi:hypothetical protein